MVKKKELLTESKAELIERARELDLPGRSKMSKEELAAEIAKALTRAAAVRGRRTRVLDHKPTATTARRALEERARKAKAITEPAKPEQVAAPVPVPAPAPESPKAGKIPSRAARPQKAHDLPPGIESLDMDENNPSSTSILKKMPAPAREPAKIHQDSLFSKPLPREYGRDRFVLLTRDPRWLFAYWEITPETENEIHAKGGSDIDRARKIIRVYDIAEGKPEVSFDVQIHPGAKSWYIHVPHDGRTWRVEIGFLGHSGRFYPIFESNSVATPRKAISNVIDEKYRVLDEEFDEIFALSGGREAGSLHQGTGGSAARAGELPEWAAPGSSGLSSRFSVPGVAPQQDFFFWVDCELIVYGGTQPDATVKVSGRDVPLRPDGTFTVRYSLPDGKLAVPCEATKADGKKSLKKEPTVTRTTK